MKKKILVLGATGMIGHVIFNVLMNDDRYDVYGTARRIDNFAGKFPPENFKRIRAFVDADDFDSIMRVMAAVQPDVVINCIGIIKQIPFWAKDPLKSITINAQLPHKISMICRASNARMIQLSTDCVFEGTKSNYTEEDNPDALDIYGRTKFLGEVYYPHCVTIRTSTIGHELKGGFGLLEWFLSQAKEATGFKKAIFTGFPTNELASIIASHIIPNEELTGLYHVSTKPISKYDLLKIIAHKYKMDIEIKPNESFISDRSLNNNKFINATGYKLKEWNLLIDEMYNFYKSYGLYREYYDLNKSIKYWNEQV